MPFSQLKLHPDLVRALKALNFEKPMPIQEAAIPLALEGRDILGCAQTGSGKTAAFALPILNHLMKEQKPGIRALILVPTRELAAQVEKVFRECGQFASLKTAVVIGGVGFSPQVSAAARCQILVATPGRLLDHLRQRSFRLDKVEQLVLDEADRMFDMGFLPDIRSIITQLPRERQTQLFSATLAPEVQRIAAFALRDPHRIEIAKPTTVAEGISQILYPIEQSRKSALLVALLKSTEIKSALIFTRTKHGADKLSKRLAAEGHSVGVLHGNRSQHQRTTAMEGFRQGKLRLLVATDIAARGIDVKGISHVINFDVPRSPEDYVHRVGRTARAYGAGDAITFMDSSLEREAVRDIEKFTGLVFPRAVLPTFAYDAPSPHTPDHSSRPPQRNDSHRHGQPGPRRNGPGSHGREDSRRNDRPGNSGRNDPPRRGNPPPPRREDHKTHRREDPPRKGSHAPGSYRGKFDPVGHPTRPRGYF